MMRGIRRVSVWDIALALATAAALAIVLLWQYGYFVAGRFAYHDLTLITDFFSNAIVHGRPFWVTNFGFYHLRTHFTPSLVAWIPAFVVFEGQFALIAVSAATVLLGVFIACRDQVSSLARLELSVVYKLGLVASCFIAFVCNRYTLRVLSSAHFEPFFIFTAWALLAAVRRDARFRWLLPLLLFALGVRQDAGFFLFFLLLSCLVAPRAWGTVAKQKVLLSAVVCVGYVVFASAVIMPWLGNDGGTREWSTWGRSWPEVFLAWFKDPERVIAAVRASEFAAWNAELLYVPMLNVLAWALNQAPAILFYTADAHAKQHLSFYNSAFLLPGLMLCFVFAQLHAVTWIQKLTKTNRRRRHLCLSLFTAFCLVAAVTAAVRGPRSKAEAVQLGPIERTDVFARAPLRRLVECENVHSVAADFRAIVYVPLRLDKYMYEHARGAELVVVSRHLDKSTPFYVNPDDLVRELTRDGKYVGAGSDDGYEFYLSSTVDCPRVAQP